MLCRALRLKKPSDHQCWDEKHPIGRHLMVISPAVQHALPAGREEHSARRVKWRQGIWGVSGTTVWPSYIWSPVCRRGKSEAPGTGPGRQKKPVCDHPSRALPKNSWRRSEGWSPGCGVTFFCGQGLLWPRAPTPEAVWTRLQINYICYQNPWVSEIIAIPQNFWKDSKR